MLGDRYVCLDWNGEKLSRNTKKNLKQKKRNCKNLFLKAEKSCANPHVCMKHISLFNKQNLNISVLFKMCTHNYMYKFISV